MNKHFVFFQKWTLATESQDARASGISRGEKRGPPGKVDFVTNDATRSMSNLTTKNRNYNNKSDKGSGRGVSAMAPAAALPPPIQPIRNKSN